MDIQVADERILVFKEQLAKDEAKKRAWEKKIDAFGAISKVASFLSKPKDEDFTIIHEEHRLEPFWHVAASAHYVYDRSTMYQVPVTGSEVQSVTVEGKEYTTMNGHIHTPVIEHCTEDLKEEVYVDGITGEKNPALSSLFQFSPKATDSAGLTKIAGREIVIVPPETRVSALMRTILSRMIQGIQADKIFEEKVEVSAVELCYHPVFAFQYRWNSKNKEAIMEVDGLTGQVRSGSRLFQQYLGKVLDTNFLFDIGADAAGVLIPGGSIAVKVARKYMETKKKSTR
ncbi:MAG TPA: hypothetical protein VMR81_02160 [Patescibacteria group bacterium]|nr:hypothetical protein [Patescibacteria group bacterium]